MYKIDPDKPLGKLPKEQLEILLYGTNGIPVTFPYTNRYGRTRYFMDYYEGLIPALERAYREAESDWARQEIEQYMSHAPLRRLPREAPAPRKSRCHHRGEEHHGRLRALRQGRLYVLL
jgi:excinuclease UvrABC ATPase subunit